jgi:hypothetical protein
VELLLESRVPFEPTAFQSDRRTYLCYELYSRASDGPSNDQDNHHRRGILVFEGRPQISRRYAIDWMEEKSGALFSGDEYANQAHSSVRETGPCGSRCTLTSGSTPVPSQSVCVIGLMERVNGTISVK